MCAPIAGLATKAIKGAGAAALGGLTGALFARKKKDKLTKPGFTPSTADQGTMA